jgi:NCS1 family nucleobase:cation symporter-1
MSQDLTNEDLAPVPQEKRTWSHWNFAALWVSMAACIPTYMLASSLIEGGMNWWQAVLTVFIGNVIVLIPMVLNAHAGTAYGIPFPIYCRAAFGVRGANIPALLRALVACGWFGIQTWIGGVAIHKILGVMFPSMLGGDPLPVIAISFSQFVCFLIFWGINVWLIHRGIHTIRFLLVIKAPILIGLGVLLVAWAWREAGGLGPMLSAPSAFAAGGPREGEFMSFFLPALTGMVGFWATLSLNIPDFSRYARSQFAQIAGQAIGLPPSMALYSFIGVAVTSATAVIYGAAIWDPIDVLTRFSNPLVLVLAMFSLVVATLSTNIAANVVSPANDFSHLSPKRINFRMGGYITAIIGIVIMPWKLVADPTGYIFTWLIAYSALLGPIGGILISDYIVHRQRKLDVTALYAGTGEHAYPKGFSLVAIAALILGVLPSLPGFLVVTKVLEADAVPGFFVNLYHYAWFTGFAVSFAAYLILRKIPRLRLA